MAPSSWFALSTLGLCAALSACASAPAANVREQAPVAATTNKRAGGVEGSRAQVFRPADGEVLLGGMIILKATPQQGTGGGEMMIANLTPGFSTDLHRHEEADEFFYVASGTGFVVLDTTEVAIGPGDAIFIPRGHRHQLKNTSSGQPLQMVAFLDRPGLADYFRKMHRGVMQTETNSTVPVNP